LRLARSGSAGALAGGTDLATLTLLVQVAHFSPRTASVPALTFGAIVMFFGQKYLAFQTAGKPSFRELGLFALVQLGGLALTALGFDLLLRTVPLSARHYVLSRLVVTNLVWLAYSFPLWHFVFRKEPNSGRGGQPRMP
jgi:putative flippase GtrA